MSDANTVISQSKGLQNLEKICNDLPILGRLTPVRKWVGKKLNRISYYYQLEQDFNALKAVYKEKLPRENWTLTKEDSSIWEEQIEFEKENYKIHIAYTTNRNEKYALACEDNSLAR